MAFNFADLLFSPSRLLRLSPLNVHVRGLRQRQVISRPGQFVTRLRRRAAAAGCPVDFPAARYAFVRSNLA